MAEKLYSLSGLGNTIGNLGTGVKNAAINLFKSDDAPGDYTTRLASIARQKKLADMLSQMGAQEQAVSTAGGITAPVSGMGALARGLTSFGGAYLSGKASRDEEAATAAENAAINKELARIFGRTPATEASQGDYIGDDAEGVPNYNVNAGKPASDILDPESRMNALYTLGGGSSLAKNAADRYLPFAMNRLGRAEDLQDTNRNRENEITDAALIRGQEVTDETRRRLEPEELRDAGFRPGTVAYIDGRGRITVPQAGETPSQIANATRVPTMRFVTVDGPDGKPRRVMMSDAQIVAAQAGGVNVSDTVVKALPRLTSQQFIKLGESLIVDINTAAKLKDYMKSVGSTPQGFKLIAQDFVNKFTTAFGGSLKGDALQVAMQRGTLQQLIGNLRIETVGGGVMTEQDALRVIQALGGNLNLLRNKDEVEGQIRKILESKEARIKQNMQFYNRDAEIQGVAPMEYDSADAAADNTGGAAVPRPNGKVPPGIGLTQEEWDRASPEDAALFK